MRSHDIQVNFLSGVLDPRAKARIDTDAYANGLQRGVNIEPHHLGGVRRRRGFNFLDKLPYALTRRTVMTATAPAGGTANNAKDNNELTVVTTTAIGTDDPSVIVHYDLSGAVSIAFADAMNIKTNAGSTVEVQIQYSTDDITWTTLGAAFEEVDTTARNYRVGNPFSPVSARYWRIAKIGGTDLGVGTITVSDFNLWTMGTSISNVRLISFEVGTEEQYLVALTDGNAAIYDANTGLLICNQPVPYASANLPTIDAATDAETMAIVHGNFAPAFLIRETTTNFQWFKPTFIDIEQLDYADSLSPTPTSDVQVVTFTSNFNSGDTFQVSIGTDKSALITYAGDNSATASNIATEVQKMWIVNGFTGVTCVRTGTREFTITLAAASADAYPLATIVPLSSNGTGTFVHSVTGVARREPAWSSTRGYPLTVEFHQGRMYFGGLRSKQQVLAASGVNNILSFAVGEGLDDDAIFTTLNGRQLNAVQGLFSGRSLQVFTSGGEFRYPKESDPITPSDAPVNQTQYGSARIRPVSIDGRTLYVQRNRKSVRDFRFDYTQNAYDSLGVSALAPHLIYDVKDMAVWNGSAVDEIGLVLVVNGTNSQTVASDGYDPFPTGTIAVLNSRKESNITAWTIWTTDGQYRAVASVFQDIFTATARTINNVGVLTLEKGNPDAYLDCSIITDSGSPNATVTGLDHLNGELCRVRADGFVFPDVTPSAGSATLSQTATDTEIGLEFDVEVTPMPMQTNGPVGSNLMRKARVVRASARLRNTLGLFINGRKIPDRAFDVNRFGAAATPYTGNVRLEETTNWDQNVDKLVSFTQTDPLPFELLGIDIKMESDS